MSHVQKNQHLMFNVPPKQVKMKPILYPEEFLLKKISSGPIWNPSIVNIDHDHVCLLKYFPKYYKCLKVDLKKNQGKIRSKVNQVKIVRKFAGYNMIESKINRQLNKLLKNSRKTMIELPKCTYKVKSGWGASHQTASDMKLHMYFPMIKSVDFLEQFKLKDEEKMVRFSNSVEKELFRACGYFWMASREIKNLKISNRVSHYLTLLNKFNECERFLSALKTVKLTIYRQRKMLTRDEIINLLKCKNFLARVTHLEFNTIWQAVQYQNLVESLINSCHNLYSLSIQIGIFPPHYRSSDDVMKNYANLLTPIKFNQNLINLQELDLEVNHLTAFINGIELPITLRKIRLYVNGFDGIYEFREVLDSQDCSNDEVDPDQRNWKSFENSKILIKFFDEWRTLVNLKVLNLQWRIISKMGSFVNNFLLPVLKAIPNLETFDCAFEPGYRGEISQEDRVMDLDIFLKGLESLKSLTNLKIAGDYGNAFYVRYHPQIAFLPPNLSFIKISTKSLPDFNILKFFKALLKNLESGITCQEKSIELSKIRLSCAQDLTTLLGLLHSFSKFRAVKIRLEVDLSVKDFSGEIVSNFRYPICLTSSQELRLNIVLPFEKGISLTNKDNKYLQRVFGQLKLVVYQVKDQNRFFVFDRRSEYSHESPFILFNNGLTYFDD